MFTSYINYKKNSWGYAPTFLGLTIIFLTLVGFIYNSKNLWNDIYNSFFGMRAPPAKMIKVGSKLMGHAVSDASVKAHCKIDARVILSFENKLAEVIAYSTRKLNKVKLAPKLRASAVFLAEVGQAAIRLTQDVTPQGDKLDGSEAFPASMQG